MTEEDEAFEELSRRQGDWGLQGSRKHQIMRYAENVENKGTSMTDKEAMKMALDALIAATPVKAKDPQMQADAIVALKEALAQPEQEPFGYFQYAPHFDAWVQNRDSNKGVAFYTHPPQREWVGLTDEEIAEGIKQSWVTEQAFQSAAWWAEAKLKEKNT